MFDELDTLPEYNLKIDIMKSRNSLINTFQFFYQFYQATGLFPFRFCIDQDTKYEIAIPMSSVAYFR